jgi:hypothetical protein
VGLAGPCSTIFHQRFPAVCDGSSEKAKGFGHHKLQSSAVPPSNSVPSPCCDDYPYHATPHTSFPLYHPLTTNLFSYFLLFPFLHNHPLYHLCLSHQNLSLSLLSPTFGSRQIPSFWIWEKKGETVVQPNSPCVLCSAAARSAARCTSLITVTRHGKP